MERSQKRIINQSQITPGVKPGVILCGKVKHFNQRGRKLGFPTANINLHRPIKFGVYLGLCKVINKQYPCLIFIGQPLTFNEIIPRVEIYIDQFNSNLYNQWISVKLMKYLRTNRKFKVPQRLIQQINKDLYVFRHHPISTTSSKNK